VSAEQPSVEALKTVRYYLNIVAEEDAHAEAIAALDSLTAQLESHRFCWTFPTYEAMVEAMQTATALERAERELRVMHLAWQNADKERTEAEARAQEYEVVDAPDGQPVIVQRRDEPPTGEGGVT
jgi:hypothetical protein